MGEIWVGALRGAAGFEKTVVVKRVLSHLEDDPEFLRRFLDEARIAAALTHGNIVPVFDLGVDADGTFFLAMERVDGWDLRKVLRTLRSADEAMPPDVAASIAADLCAALAYAHAQTDADGVPRRIVHRDVSPSNVLLARSGEVKLTDFGIASARERLGKTATGQLRGKFSYMSPEQAVGRRLDGRSDLFAVGALLYEMLSGGKAFDGTSDLETLEKVRTGDRVPLAECCAPDTPPSLIAIVERALAMDPADRFADGEAMEQALREVIATEWGVVGPARVRRWATDRLDDDPVLRAQDRPGGASLDDLLNAQLDQGGDRLTPSHTDSRSLSGAARVWSPSRTGGADRSGSAPPVVFPAARSGSGPRDSGTMTAAAPRRPRRKALRWVAGVGLVVVAALAAAFAMRPPPPRLVVESTPPGAQVYIDGVPSGVTNLRLRPAPGEHEVRVALPGYSAEPQTIALRRGDTPTLVFELQAADRRVAFHSIPAGAVVSVDGVELPAGNSLGVPVGQPVSVTMTLDGHETLTEEVTFGADDTVFTRRLVPVPVVARDAGADPEEVAVAPDRDVARDPRPPRDSGPSRPERDDSGDRPSRTPPTVDAEPVEVLPPGRLTVRFVEPPMVGEITIDGESRGTNRDLRAVYELAPGDHEITVENAAMGVRYSRQLRIESGANQTIAVEWR